MTLNTYMASYFTGILDLTLNTYMASHFTGILDLTLNTYMASHITGTFDLTLLMSFVDIIDHLGQFPSPGSPVLFDLSVLYTTKTRLIIISFILSCPFGYKITFI